MLRLLKQDVSQTMSRSYYLSTVVWNFLFFLEERLRVYMPLVCETFRMQWTSNGWHIVVASGSVPTQVINRLLYVD